MSPLGRWGKRKRFRSPPRHHRRDVGPAYITTFLINVFCIFAQRILLNGSRYKVSRKEKGQSQSTSLLPVKSQKKSLSPPFLLSSLRDEKRRLIMGKKEKRREEKGSPLPSLHLFLNFPKISSFAPAAGSIKYA